MSSTSATSVLAQRATAVQALVNQSLEDSYLPSVTVLQNISSFIGGSARFGWGTKSSDVDIFVLVPAVPSFEDVYPEVLECFGRFVRRLGLKPVGIELREGSNPPGYYHFQTSYLNTQVDVLITADREYFEAQQTEHKGVKGFLETDEGKRFLSTINVLRSQVDIKGRYIYRTTLILSQR